MSYISAVFQTSHKYVFFWCQFHQYSLISPKFYTQLLCPQIPKAQEIQSSHKCLFALLGSVQLKGAHKMMMKLTPWLIFINVFCSAVTHEDPKSAKRQSCHKSLFALLGSTRVKAAGKIMLKLTHDISVNALL